MNTNFKKSKTAFTLIELLVVIAIIGILATLVTGLTVGAKKKGTESRIRSQMQNLETQIEAYKSALGMYPPDNPNDPVVNPLFYELNGVIADNNAMVFRLPGDNATINPADVKAVFGVDGFANVANSESELRYSISDWDANMVTDLLQTDLNSSLKVLSVGVQWKEHEEDEGKFESPLIHHDANPLGSSSVVNTWRYNSSNPKYNTTSYDLWAEVVIGNDVFIIGNWED